MSLLNFEKIIIITKDSGYWVKGHYIEGDKNYDYAYANVQPINGDELQNLPEGDRIKGTLKIYSSTKILDNYFIRRIHENIKKAYTCIIDNVLDTTNYTCTINGTEFLYNSGIGATKFSIVDGIVNEILLGSELVTVENNLDGSYTVTSSIEGTDFELVVDYNQIAALDTENVCKEYKCMQDKDYSVHNISHYKAYGFLVERKNGL